MNTATTNKSCPLNEHGGTTTINLFSIRVIGLHDQSWFFFIAHIFDHECAYTVINMEEPNEYGALLMKMVKFIREAAG